LDNSLYRRDVSVTSLTASDLGTPGDYRTEGAKVYQLVYANVSLSHGAPYQYESATSGTDGYKVGVVHNTTTKADGVYNAGTASCAASTYFWGQVRGVGAVLASTTLASNVAARGSTGGVVVAISSAVGEAFRTIGACATATTTYNMNINCK
jgi:hypothetical protein